MAKDKEYIAPLAPAIAEYLTKKNGGVPVTGHLGPLSGEVVIKLTSVFDNLNTDINNAQAALNKIELRREMDVERVRAKNPDLKGEAAYAAADGAAYSAAVDNITDRVSRRIRSEFEKAGVRQYSEEAVREITSSMQKMATRDARDAMDKAVLAKTVRVPARAVAEAGGHGVGANLKGGDIKK